MTYYVHTKFFRPDGTTHSHRTFEVESKDAPMPHHLRGLSYTATGYGSRIPTPHMIKFNGRWRRVYCRVFSNIGTLFIGHGENRFIVNLEN